MTHFPLFCHSTFMLMGLPQWGQVRDAPCWVFLSCVNSDNEHPQSSAICSTFANVIEPLLICCDKADWVIPNFSAMEEMVCP